MWSNPRDPDTTGHGNVIPGAVAVGPNAFTVTACVLIFLATFVGEVLLAISALVGLVVLAASFWPERLEPVRAARVPLALLPAVFLGLGLLWPSYTVFPHPSAGYFISAAAVLAVATVLANWRSRLTQRALMLILLAVLGVTAIVGFVTIVEARGFGMDVLWLHMEASDALLNGSDPYGEAVSVADGSPIAPPGSSIVGYPYPPVTAVLHAIPTWLLGDPRWISLSSWLGVLTVLGIAALKTSSRSRILILILLASIPTWSLVLQAGWTEMVTLALVTASVALWIRRPLASAVLLGLAVASKQYFIFALPLLLLHPDLRGKRSVWALVTAALTFVPFLIAGPASLWNSIVSFHVNLPPRPDSVNLVGMFARFDIAWTPPRAVAFGLPLLAAIWLARRSRGRTGFLKALAVILGLVFMLSTGAFANYWFLVAAICGVAAFYETEERAVDASQAAMTPA